VFAVHGGAGVIEEYRPQLDYAAVGYDVTALFHLDVAGQGLPEVVEELQANERMIGVYEVTGSHDVVLDTVREYAQPPVERT